MPGRRIRRVAWIAGGLLILALAGVGTAVHRFANDRDPPIPAQRPPDLLPLFSDTRPVRITTTTPSWTKVAETVTVDRLRTDLTLWRRMHFGDWDKISPTFREIGLAAMLRAYAPVILDQSAWRRMTASDWDDVPQPIRMMAFLRMIWYWARLERLGHEFDLRPDRLAQTVSAIVMAESWFEHRAVNENPWGNRDLGLAQCSDYCREELVRMAQEGLISFLPAARHYFDPWVATRIAIVWFERELLHAGGDVELAIRAYHRGPDQAMDDLGDAYLARVLSLRERYIRTQRTSPTWEYLTEEIRRRSS
jgi:hypothetical protein